MGGYLGWTWGALVHAESVLAVAVGTARDIAVRFLPLDVVLLAAARMLVTRRRARAVLFAARRQPPDR